MDKLLEILERHPKWRASFYLALPHSPNVLTLRFHRGDITYCREVSLRAVKQETVPGMVINDALDILEQEFILKLEQQDG